MKGGNGKTDELTFEQPEEIALRKSKTGRRRRYTEFEPDAIFAPTKVVPRVNLFPVFRRNSKDGIFLLFASLA